MGWEDGEEAWRMGFGEKNKDGLGGWEGAWKMGWIEAKECRRYGLREWGEDRGRFKRRRGEGSYTGPLPGPFAQSLTLKQNSYFASIRLTIEQKSLKIAEKKEAPLIVMMTN